MAETRPTAPCNPPETLDVARLTRGNRRHNSAHSRRCLLFARERPTLRGPPPTPVADLRTDGHLYPFFCVSAYRVDNLAGELERPAPAAHRSWSDVRSFRAWWSCLSTRRRRPRFPPCERGHLPSSLGEMPTAPTRGVSLRLETPRGRSDCRQSCFLLSARRSPHR